MAVDHGANAIEPTLAAAGKKFVDCLLVWNGKTPDMKHQSCVVDIWSSGAEVLSRLL
jgi:hypothetical protein